MSTYETFNGNGHVEETINPRGTISMLEIGFDAAHDRIDSIGAELSRGALIPEEQLQMYKAGIATQSNMLLESPVGLGKTHIANLIAKAIGGHMGRIQGTPDVMPSDIIGARIYNEKAGKFEFSAGPIFYDVVLGDEASRMKPKTQSAFLEALQEGQVTPAGMNETYKLPETQIVMLTQNPAEVEEGTSELVRALRDRMALNFVLRSLSRSDMLAIREKKEYQAKQVTDPHELKMIADEVESIPASRDAEELAAETVTVLRTTDIVDPNESMLDGYRGFDETVRAAKALALVEKDRMATVSHVKRVAPYTLRHRVGLTYAALDEKITPEEAIDFGINKAEENLSKIS